MGSVIGYPEAHGAIATFETDISDDIKSLMVDIEPVQVGNGIPSEENIRSITGWTSSKITHHGKNMAQYWQQGYIGIDGSIKAGSTYAISKPVFVQNGKPIAVSNASGDYQGIAVFSDSSLENMIYRLANTASSYTASQDCYVVFWFNKVYSEYTESDFVDRGVQIEFNYSPTDYEPYSYDEYDILFPSEAGTVYGGKIDVTKGELIVDKAIVDLGTLDWSKSNLGYFTSDSIKSLIVPPVGQKNPADVVCSKYATLSYTQVYVGDTNGVAVIGDTSANDIGRLTINDLTMADSTAEDFKSSLSGIMLVYKVKSPVSYTLTPREIQTIIGTNNIYANTGDTSVLYPKTMTPEETVSNVNIMELRRGIIASQPHLETISGTSLSFKSAVKKPESLIVNIEPIQSGTGDPSPDNIRPISGRTKATVTINGTDIEINFPSSAGTVYGGWLDLLGGELVVDRLLWSKNTKNMNTPIETYPGWEDAGVLSIYDKNHVFIVYTLNVGPGITINTNYDFNVPMQYDRAYFSESGYKGYKYKLTKTQWKNKAIDVQVILPLPNPITYQFDPITVELLKGDNTITADCGDTTITYWAN